MPAPAEDDPGPAGELLVQPRVRLRGGAPQRLDEVLGDALAVIARDDPAKWLDAASQAFLERVGARLFAASELEDQDGWLDELLARHLALVVRPDRYVLGAADDAPALQRLVEGLRRAFA
jgi:3-(3-hydroxy-phenyl)propionate hydroxylase